MTGREEKVILIPIYYPVRYHPPEESSHRVLVCGGPRMVMGVLQGLRGLGHSSEKTFVYGQFGVQQIRAVYGKSVELAQHRETNNNINGYYH